MVADAFAQRPDRDRGSVEADGLDEGGQDWVGGEEAQGYGRAADGHVEGCLTFHVALDLGYCLLAMVVP
jgi:hypothetical protein